MRKFEVLLKDCMHVFTENTMQMWGYTVTQKPTLFENEKESAK